MCGIVGVYQYSRSEGVNKEALVAMTQAIRHRGPDDGRVHVEGPVGLGHRRLSIIDLASGQQPMNSPTAQSVIVFNGEIYNYKSLQEHVRQQGRQLHTSSDTEVILHLYELYGVDCVKWLRGMFAFAIWDRKKRSLFLARDRVGKKPLYYADISGELLFGSEIKGILAYPGVSRRVDPESIHNFLTLQYIPEPATAFEGIRKLPPGHWLEVSEAGLRLESYWSLDFQTKTTVTEADAIERLDELLDEAVRIRLMSEVPLGAFLSGGIDSSLVVAYMAKHLPKVKTFTVGFTDEEFNELHHARRVAEQYGTDHHEFMCEPDALKVLPQLVWHFDEPFGDPSALPTYYLSQMTRDHVTVALNGDGGDEGFAGYRRYALSAKLGLYDRFLPHWFRQCVDQPLTHLSRLVPNRYTRGVSRMNRNSLRSPAESYSAFMTIFPADMKEALYTDRFAHSLAGRRTEEYLTNRYDTPGLTSSVDRMLWCDTMTYLPGDLLVKVDRMTMAHGLEGRAPLLDHMVLEFAASLPGDMKLQDGVLKHLLKRVGERYLPTDLLHRRKQGFGVPLNTWFRTSLKDWLQEMLAEMTLVSDGYLHGPAVTKLVSDHLSGRADHGHRLWLLVNLELWYRTFIHSSAPLLGAAR